MAQGENSEYRGLRQQSRQYVRAGRRHVSDTCAPNLSIGRWTATVAAEAPFRAAVVAREEEASPAAAGVRDQIAPLGLLEFLSLAARLLRHAY